MADPLLQVKSLSVAFGGRSVLCGFDLDLAPGEIHGLVGESGSGKSITALSVMRLLPRNAIMAGNIILSGQKLERLGEEHLNAIRGDQMAMIFQEPMTALNPVQTIGDQIAEGIRLHRDVSPAEALDMAARAMARVELPPSRYPLSRYPHELSGGQRQRVMIAMATALKPKLLIADEPTTALDVVLQAQVLKLLRTVVDDTGMALLLISHDLGVVAEMADSLTILQSGQIREQGNAVSILRHRKHAYTRQLAEASTHVPQWKNRGQQASGNALVSIKNLVKTYRSKRTLLPNSPEDFTAVDDVSFDIATGRSVGLVGQSGCGKSTLARLILALDTPTGGAVQIDGIDLGTADQSQLRRARRRMQVVFQDPYGSFNPRMRVEKIIAEPLHLLNRKTTLDQQREMIADALRCVSLSPDVMRRYPHEFSGGQRQRIAIARAIITKPKLIVCDEPVSALDVSIRAEILDLFAELNDEHGMACLFITHDLAVARAITQETLVMHRGKIVERGPTAQIMDSPQSEQAQKLVAAAPNLERALKKRLGQ
ncbi:MAG: ABC transporter ATP-binding protein [Pseudomonadota bacterium]